MARREHERILQDTEREQGHTALRNNVRAALALADAVRSTIGPLGLDKMLISDDGDVQVTNDGVTVLEAAKVEHPTARMLISPLAYRMMRLVMGQVVPLFSLRNFCLTH